MRAKYDALVLFPTPPETLPFIINHTPDARAFNFLFSFPMYHFIVSRTQL
jgi:hypothetical protein